MKPTLYRKRRYRGPISQDRDRSYGNTSIDPGYLPLTKSHTPQNKPKKMLVNPVKSFSKIELEDKTLVVLFHRIQHFRGNDLVVMNRATVDECGLSMTNKMTNDRFESSSKHFGNEFVDPSK